VFFAFLTTVKKAEARSQYYCTIRKVKKAMRINPYFQVFSLQTLHPIVYIRFDPPEDLSARVGIAAPER